MVKAVLSKQGSERRTVFFGLSSKNLENLKESCPITFKGEEIGLEGIDFVIVWGETEQQIAEELEAGVASNKARK
jgi:hypothetical protein